jgi:FtsZ-interacting cell division protein YlmF
MINMAFDKLKKMLGDDDDTETVDTDSYYTMDEGKDKMGKEATGNQMVLVEPRAYSESQTIADHLKAKNTVVVNLKRVTGAQAKRIIDFLTGTLYAIGGDLQEIGPGIYLCTPKNVSVQGKISKSDDDEKSKGKGEEDIDW